MISIVIPILNEQDMSEECIHAVLENTTNCESIVIDNGSDIPFKPPFSGFIETTIIRNESNLGFPVAVNQGIRAAKGDMIVLLNNDVIVPPKWTQRLEYWLDEFSIVAPMTNYCAGLQQITIPVYENTAEFYKEAIAFSGAYDGEAEEVNFVIGFCMAFKKSLWEEIGPFDESLWPCSGEEIDFCLRARAAGHKVGIARDVYVHHFGSRTFDAMQKAGQIDYAKIVARNDKHLAEKWGADFWQKQAIERESDESEKDGSGTCPPNKFSGRRV